MLAATLSLRAQQCPDLIAMTFRVYLRWPGQRVTDKTTTDSRAVAQLAFDELAAKAALLAGQGALGISFTEDGKQINYQRLAEGVDDSQGRPR